jgi:hypothetical protein
VKSEKKKQIAQAQRYEFALQRAELARKGRRKKPRARRTIFV